MQDTISLITSKFARASADRLDNWMMSNGVTVENMKKFKLKIKQGTPSFVRGENSIIGSINTEYILYPGRGRNAKKPISSIII